MLVQVTKEETGTKGVALTTYLSLAGSFLVLTPGEPQIGISRKIEAEEERNRLKEIMGQLNFPEGIGCIVRTAGSGKSKRDIAKNLDNLLRLWEDIRNRAIEQPAPSIIYKEIDLAVRTVRDHFTPDVQEVLIDNREIYKQVKDF